MSIISRVFALKAPAAQPQAALPVKPAVGPPPVLKPALLKFSMPDPVGLPPEPQPDARKQEAPKTQILVAEDDPVSRKLLCARLEKWDYEVVVTRDGTEAMAALRQPDAPSLAILDWMMPGMDGVEICRRVRTVNRPIYLILLTARGTKDNIVEGLGAGADDYLIKPFDQNELQARVLVGLRAMALQEALADRVRALETASGEIRDLKLQLLM